MKKILIVGATSSIAEHCARQWAARGDALFLVARNSERLRAIAADLKVRGAANIATRCEDINDIACHSAILDMANIALEGLDIVLIAHGTLSDQTACESDVELTMQEIKTNALSTIAFMTIIANYMEAQKRGGIAVISSVAGDKGRRSNYVYGSAKAMVTAFASGLRLRLQSSNVAVTTIKPGLVDTPMTAALPKGRLWTSPANVSKKIVRAIDRRDGEIYVPGFWWLIMVLVSHLPDQILRKL